MFMKKKKPKIKKKARVVIGGGHRWARGCEGDDPDGLKIMGLSVTKLKAGINAAFGVGRGEPGLDGHGWVKMPDGPQPNAHHVCHANDPARVPTKTRNF